MEGKVKFVRRDVWFIENQEYSNDSDIHARRCTATYAVLYNHDEVEIDEDDIRDYYDTRYLTAGVISDLSESLHNIYREIIMRMRTGIIVLMAVWKIIFRLC